jgi:nitrate reductase delta subunit
VKRAQAAAVYACAAVLLSYPADTFTEDLAAVRGALGNLPDGPPRAGLGKVTEWLSTMTALEAAATYVGTFDLGKNTSLYLTYYRHGDTRARGLALAALVDAYRGAGVRVVDGELPDFLPALLELAAVHRTGTAMLGEYRVALDALRLALDESGSRYAPAVAAVAAVVPPPGRAEREALARYRAEGPPSEQVGLEAFAPPEVLSPPAARR